MKKLLLISIVFLFSCGDQKTYNYTVKAGEHRSVNKVTFLKKDVINYSFTTDSTWVWDVSENNGYSKVVGIAWGSNHKNSVRVAYMRSNDIGILSYYYYIDGVSPMENHSQWGKLDTITIGNTYQGRLGWQNGYYFITLNNKHHSLKVKKPKGIKNLQHPYIGGTYVIDHDWTTTQTIW